jgi:hypothetical protein
VSRHDWGSFSLGLVCRCAGLWLAAVGLARRSPAWLAGSGLALGLGLYNKIDLAPVLAATVAALALCEPRAALGAIRERRNELPAFAVGLAMGVAPLAAAGLRGAAAVGSVAGELRIAADLPEKLSTWRAFLDGSYFHRLMLAGGSFEALPDVQGAASGIFGPALVASALVLACCLVVRRPWHARERALAFALAALALGFGAAFPKFNTENAAEIPTSFGGLLYMMTAVANLGAVVVLQARPVYGVLQAQLNGGAPGVDEWVALGLGTATAMALSTLAIAAPLRIAVRRIEALDP